jgi:hypothetical protein
LEVKVTLRNPLNKEDTLDYYIIPNDTQLAQDWVSSLEEIIKDNLHLEKNYCFLGFPDTQRTVERLCDTLNQHVETINKFNYKNIWQSHGLERYIIFDHYNTDHVVWPEHYGLSNNQDDQGFIERVGLCPKDKVLNELHNHFERLQGTVENPSPYYQYADDKTKYAIRQLNNICHELESLILSRRNQKTSPEWIRPSQITTFFDVQRKLLTDEHRQGFLDNGFDRKFAHVYMHWSQIGKTLFEVFRDEDAPELTDTVCEAITHLQYYSGEFDIEWAKDVVRNSDRFWHDKEQAEFEKWLIKNNLNPKDPRLSLGYLEIGHVDLQRSFGTEDRKEIWKILSNHLDIYKIEINGHQATYDYCWSDEDFEQHQMRRLGYEVD